MVICEDYNLIFVEVPNTGCTAINRVLTQHYGGRSILHKHAVYYELKREFGRKLKGMTVFATVRSPLEVMMTQFQKMTYDHRNRFSEPERRQAWSLTPKHRKMFNDIQSGLTFSDYLQKYFQREYHNFYLLGCQHVDFLLRHESLQEGFEQVMRHVGVASPVTIPHTNKTEGKKTISEAYAPDVRRHVADVFGPFMEKWGYTFPPEWSVARPSLSRRLRFKAIESAAEFASSTLGVSPNGSPRWIQAVRDGIRPITG
ncbi:sulfotransferase family 2 domain-containing protein [Rhodopirellula sp. MGV]|uniref:sulfotransferase family 2 domain-containing protein n=1 Tax=Rhodopirellula sp. MGV TaxID=2023130 RepID=UPI000B9665AF|nr:sulfotransferase family 2 domain-containing protein [Rhodopirellula sp. MGV]OYP33012.1 hypothetical protein CGZ80_19175 [Rhodopirellula sp. MGV]PNY35326.1 hypothetical protein C2E31_17510 [Rhodopirellula baltica]